VSQHRRKPPAASTTTAAPGSRPEGRRLPPAEPRPRWKSIAKWAGIAAAAGFVLLVGLFGVAYAMTSVPQPNSFATSQATVVYYSDGKTEIGRYGATNRTSVPLSQVPDGVRKAVLAAEDRGFYENRGVSPTGMTRALWNNLRGGSTQGGSTITQQYAKNAYLSQERTLTRKFKEFFIAIKLDRSSNKDKILEDYLNTIYFGRGAYGIETASQAYFGKDVSQLTVAQGAVLASVIRSPGYYDPNAHPENLRGRFNYVISGMIKKGWLSSANAATQQVPKTLPRSRVNVLGGPKGYLLDAVKDELVAKGIDEGEIESGGLKVITTFDRRAQRFAENAVLAEGPKTNTKGLHIGLTAVDPTTGRVLAMYGGADYVKQPGQNDALARIQPGSSFKPFTLAAALENDISLKSRFDGNSPLTLPGSSKPVRNEFGQDYGSKVDLYQAIRQSINTAFVDLTLKVGAAKVKAAAIRAGIPANAPGLKADARITLGTASVSSMDMASAYGTFAAEGTHTAPFMVAEVKYAGGGIAYKAKVKKSRAFEQNVVANVDDALRQVIERSDGTGHKSAGDLGRPAAGKTGTGALRPDTTTSAWFVGYTPQVSAAVDFFKGNATENLDGVGGEGQRAFFGGGYPARVWSAFMKSYLEGKDKLDFPKPQPIGRTLNPQPTFTPTPTPTVTLTPTPTPTPTGLPTKTKGPKPPTTTITIPPPPSSAGPPPPGGAPPGG
jgi:membrane peptidoglycan carboxypeptidase